MKKATRPILWTQGLFLQPQHLQQFDLHLQSLLYPHLKFSQPYWWGVCNLNIDEDSLKNRMCEISDAEIIFPDGTWVRFPGDSSLQPRSLQEVPLEPGKLFTVFIGLRKMRDGERHVTTITSPDQSGAAQTRYLSHIDPEEVQDFHGDGPLARVRFMNFALKIFWETEVAELGDYWLMPIAKLEFVDGIIKLSKTYTPPTIAIAQSDLLKQIIKNVQDQITSRSTILEEYKSPAGTVLTDQEPHYILYILALRSLNRYIPLLHQIIADPLVHPWNMYGLLRQLIGELSSFTDRFNALGILKTGVKLLPDYDHEELHTCFTEANVLIGELLNTLTIGTQNIMILERDGDLFQGQIPLDTLDERNIFHLVIKAIGESDEILTNVMHVAKMGSHERISTLIARALPGVPLQQRQIPPPGLPRRPDSYYFKFDQDDSEWYEIKRTGNICLYWTEAPQDTEVQVIIIKT
ncbi:type VI secretion system baseplate subunit TssK [candidate division CSSED10-310 bacterium]|uniref:Type VI secretion system baseplate subunit TssK n=1 Tax=candidate division CSSED10-310 bacterium TaxID=2855610 RepID=A0ABV6YWQ2_UNCC1